MSSISPPSVGRKAIRTLWDSRQEADQWVTWNRSLHNLSRLGRAGAAQQAVEQQRAVYSWKVQVPQTSGLPRWTLVSSTPETR